MGTRAARGQAQSFYREFVMTYDGDECLIWPYARNTGGYAQVHVDDHFKLVSRLVCAQMNGPAPTLEHQAAHSCGKGHLGCVTKGHLSWKTRTANKADELIHGTRNRGERHGKAKLTEADVREIRSLKGSTVQRNLAVKFGVSIMQVSSIQSGKTWTWLQ